MGIFLSASFLLFVFIPSFDLKQTKTALVTLCPKNQTEVNEASMKLGCDNDKYGNSQYMCLPKKDKTSLVELCFDGVMGIRNKGICLEVDKEDLINHSCNSFSYGCPDTHFFDYEIYKYPACQDINTELRCYVSDPICSPKPRTEESVSHEAIVILVSILVLAIAVICFVLCYCWRKKKQEKSRRNSAGFNRIRQVRQRNRRTNSKATHVPLRMAHQGKKEHEKAERETQPLETITRSSDLESSA